MMKMKTIRLFLYENMTAFALGAGNFLMLFLALIHYKYGMVPHLANMDPQIGSTVKKLYFAFVAVMLLFEFAVIGLMFAKKVRVSLEKLAVCTVALFGLIFMFFLPPLSAPDEDAHYITSYALSDRLMFTDSEDDDGYVYMRRSDTQVALHRHTGHGDYQTLIQGLFDRNVDSEMVPCNMKREDIIFWAFLPQAVGMTVSRLLGFGQINMMMTGRLFNLAFFILMLALAMKRMPKSGKWILFLISMFPMTLEQISSLSYDAFVFGLSFYFIAIVMDLAFEKKTITNKDIVLMIAVMAILAPVKVIYGFLSFLCFLIPREKFGTKKKYIIVIVCMVIAVSATILISQGNRFSQYVAGSNNTLDMPENEENPLSGREEAEQYAQLQTENGTQPVQPKVLYTFSDILKNPKLAVLIWGNTIRLQGYVYMEQMFGTYLGWLNPNFKVPSIVIVGIIILFLTTFVQMEGEKVPTYRQKALYSAVFLIVATLSCLFMLVAHTENTSSFCMGVQGRYFLPALPLLPYVFRNHTFVRKKDGKSGANERNFNLIRIWCASALVLLAVIAVYERIIAAPGSNILPG